MTPRDQHPDEDLRDPLLSRLYRELPDAQPDPATDERLRAAARRAVADGPRRRRAVRMAGAHWRGLVASAACLALGVALTLHWQTREPARLEAVLATVPAAVPPPADAGAGASPAVTPPHVPAAPPPARAERPSAVAKAAPRTPAEAGADADRITATLAGDAVDAAPAPADDGDQRMAAGGAAAAEAARREERTAPAEARTDAARERKALALRALPQAAPAAAAPAPAAPAAAGDYRTLMASGDYAAALAALPPRDDRDTSVLLDGDLLHAWRAPGTPPACARQALPLARDRLLCEALLARAAGRPDAEGLARLRAAGVADRELAYRRALLEQLFAATP